MAFTNSSLVNYTRISPNRGNVVNGKRVYGRDHAIDTVSIHCVVGQCTVEALGSIFASASKQASSNYGIGYDGRIGMYVEEKDRSWCTSSRANDNRAVTIEVASDTKHPYRVNDAAYKSLIKLLADICRRNGIKKLVWSTDKNDRINHRNGCNMTVHRDFANKACPGDYLYNLHGQIATEVNKILSQEDDDNMKRYQTLADVPAGDYRDAVQKGMDAGVIRGDSRGNINLSEDMIRCLIFFDRMLENAKDEYPKVDEAAIVQKVKDTLKFNITVE